MQFHNPNGVGSSNRRHCAFCLQICGVPAKLCDGCNKRAYCSIECQAADWNITGSGQRHKNWCGRFEHGEEDVDWEVVPVLYKGLGVRAKRLIPAGFRIIVEPALTDHRSHPGIKDLEPKGRSLNAKFRLNSFRGSPKLDRGRPLIGLRSSRLNHNCSPNAGMSTDYIARTIIIFSLRDIQPGEEICICYCDRLHPNLNPDINISILNESKLLFNWEIICPDDCFCKKEKTRILIVRAKHLFNQLRGPSTIKYRLKVGVKLLEIYDLLGISWVQKNSLLHELWEMDTSQPNNKCSGRKHQFCIDSLKICRIISPFEAMQDPKLDECLERIDVKDNKFLNPTSFFSLICS